MVTLITESSYRRWARDARSLKGIQSAFFTEHANKKMSFRSSRIAVCVGPSQFGSVCPVEGVG